MRFHSEAQYREALDKIDEDLSAIYRARREIMEAFSEDYPPVLPPPTRRTAKQDAIARCPRCSMLLGSETDGAKI